MGHASGPVAVLLVEYAEMEENIVEQKEKETPFHERHIEPPETLCAESPRIIGISCVEEIACCDEEERHVECVYEVCEEFGSFRVPYNHQYDGDAFGDGYYVVSHIVESGKMKKRAAIGWFAALPVWWQSGKKTYRRHMEFELYL